MVSRDSLVRPLFPLYPLTCTYIYIPHISVRGQKKKKPRVKGLRTREAYLYPVCQKKTFCGCREIIRVLKNNHFDCRLSLFFSLCSKLTQREIRLFALLRPASAPLAVKIRTAYFGINTAGSNVNLMRP